MRNSVHREIFFIVYQLYRLSYDASVGLLLLTLFDIVVVGLTWHEYRLRG